MALLTDDEVRAQLGDLPGWELGGGAIRKEYVFKGFRARDRVHRPARGGCHRGAAPPGPGEPLQPGRRLPHLARRGRRDGGRPRARTGDRGGRRTGRGLTGTWSGPSSSSSSACWTDRTCTSRGPRSSSRSPCPGGCGAASERSSERPSGWASARVRAGRPGPPSSGAASGRAIAGHARPPARGGRRAHAASPSAPAPGPSPARSWSPSRGGGAAPREALASAVGRRRWTARSRRSPARLVAEVAARRPRRRPGRRARRPRSRRSRSIAGHRHERQDHHGAAARAPRARRRPHASPTPPPTGCTAATSWSRRATTRGSAARRWRSRSSPTSPSWRPRAAGILLRGIGVAATTTSRSSRTLAPTIWACTGSDTLDQLAEVKATITRITRPDGWDVLNADDPRVLAMRRGITGRPWLCSIDHDHPALREVARGRRPRHDRRSTAIADLARADDAPTPLLPLRGRAGHASPASRRTTRRTRWRRRRPPSRSGCPSARSCSGLRTFVLDPERNPGRANLFALDGRIVVVDYAHNEAGMRGLAELCDGLAAPAAARSGSRSARPATAPTTILHDFGVPGRARRRPRGDRRAPPLPARPRPRGPDRAAPGGRRGRRRRRGARATRTS